MNPSMTKIIVLMHFILACCLFANRAYATENVALVETKTATVSMQLSLHERWQTLVSQHVKPINNGHSSAVDYDAMLLQRTLLKDYLARLSQVTKAEFDGWPKEQQLAFLINAYNAWTVEFILATYPNLESIKDLGSFFSSPWKKEFIPLFGEIVSLDYVEHGLIRGSDRYNDPRIHFAVNCASIGCPALREEAYTAEKLEQQLTEQTTRFLTDTTRNYIKGDNLYLSSIFKWYRDDFEAGFRGTQSLEDFLLLYATALTLTENQKSALHKQDLNIKFLDYNWKLNATE